MNAKTAIDRIIGKGGLKLGSSRADGGFEKGVAAPRKSMEEVATGKGRMTEPERSELLQVSRAVPEPARAVSHEYGTRQQEPHLSSQNFWCHDWFSSVRQSRQTLSFALSFSDIFQWQLSE